MTDYELQRAVRDELRRIHGLAIPITTGIAEQIAKEAIADSAAGVDMCRDRCVSGSAWERWYKTARKTLEELRRLEFAKTASSALARSDD